MFVNLLDATMVNAYIIYKENFKNMNMPAPEKPPKPLEHDKFMSGVIHKLIGNFLAVVSLTHQQHCLPLLFIEESMILSISWIWGFSSLEDATIVASV